MSIELEELNNRIAAAEEDIWQTKMHMQHTTRRAKLMSSLAFVSVLGSILVNSHPAANAFGSPGVNLAALVSNVDSLIASRTTDEQNTSSNSTAITNLTSTVNSNEAGLNR